MVVGGRAAAAQASAAGDGMNAALKRSKKSADSDWSMVLLVEDAHASFDETGSILRAAGYGVVHATTAVDALDILRGPRRIDLLLTAVDIPNQPSGFTLARMARLRRPGLAVLYLAASGEPNRKEAERALGPVLQTPTPPDVLVQHVKAAIKPTDAG